MGISGSTDSPLSPVSSIHLSSFLPAILTLKTHTPHTHTYINSHSNNKQQPFGYQQSSTVRQQKHTHTQADTFIPISTKQPNKSSSPAAHPKSTKSPQRRRRNCNRRLQKRNHHLNQDEGDEKSGYQITKQDCRTTRIISGLPITQNQAESLFPRNNDHAVHSGSVQ